MNAHTQNNVTYRNLEEEVPSEHIPSFKIQKTEKKQFEAMMEYLQRNNVRSKSTMNRYKQQAVPKQKPK